MCVYLGKEKKLLSFSLEGILFIYLHEKNPDLLVLHGARVAHELKVKFFIGYKNG